MRACSFTSRYTQPFTKADGSIIMVPSPEAYKYNAYWLCAMPAAAFFLILFLNVRKEDRQLRHAKKDLRVRLWKWLCVCKLRLQDPEEQDVEYCEAVKLGLVTDDDAVLLSPQTVLLDSPQAVVHVSDSTGGVHNPIIRTDSPTGTPFSADALDTVEVDLSPASTASPPVAAAPGTLP